MKKVGARRVAALVLGSGLGLGVALGIASCSQATPALSQCEITTNGGFGSNGQGITGIVHPGGRVDIGNGETSWYYPCNARNFVTAKHGGDRSDPLAVRTAAAGGTPGMPVYIWSSVYFTANQNESAMKAFLPFCLKYGCATNDSQTDASISASAHSSQPGWENMLLENMGPAVDRASETAAAQFGPTLWHDQADWNKLGNDIAAGMNTQLATETGSKTPYFCGDNSTQSNCMRVTVVVSNVTPEDPAVITEYNQQVAAEQSGAVNAARLAAAQQLYGKQNAGYFLGIMDASANCQKCTFIIGNPGQVSAAAAGK